MMEVWLNEEKGGGMFRFPIIPMPLGPDSSASVDTVSIVKKGKVAIYNGVEPNTIHLESFFPKFYGSYCNYKDFPSPNACVEQIKDWEKSGAILRLIATGTPINERVIITGFHWHYKYGNGSIYYSLTLMQKEKIELKEFVPPKKPPTKKVVNNTATKNKNDEALKLTPEIIASQAQVARFRDPIVKNRNRVKMDKYENYIYTVQKGDSLNKIAKMLYGSSKDWRLIKQNPINQKNYSTLKKNNSLKVGWKLVIP